MRILAFTDTHESAVAMQRLKRAVKEEQVDLALCAGDFTIFGRRTRQMLHELDGLGVPVVFVHGNHEDEDEIRELLKGTKNLHWVHHTVLDLKGLRFMGHGGSGFAHEEPDLEAFEQRIEDRFDERTIFISHAPPYATGLDQPDEGWHVGSASLRGLILRRRPMLVLCGHIHECAHRHDTLAGTTIINPGPDGEVIEVDDG